MPNTITAYHTMVADTRARASQANTNWSNHRGTLVPINTDTATASHRTHDLGASDHYWNDVYNQRLIMGYTSTATIQIASDTTGSLTMSFGASNQVFNVNHVGNNLFQVNTSGAIIRGRVDVLSAGTTVTAIDSTGMLFMSRAIRRATTGAGNLGNMVIGNNRGDIATNSVGVVFTISSGVLTTNGGPVCVELQGAVDAAAVRGYFTDHNCKSFKVEFVRSATTITSMLVNLPDALTTTGQRSRIPCTAFRFKDTSVTAGTWTYSCAIVPFSDTISSDSVQLVIYEFA